MKLTTSDSIKENEKNFIDNINAELDWEAIEKLIQERHNFLLQDEVEYKSGDLTVHQNQVAYRFEFELKVPLTLICDRNGECLSINSARKDEEFSETKEIQETGPIKDNPMDPEEQYLSERQKKRTKELVSDIAQKINDINQEDE